ncbi:type I glyceraldehyde-3-phosphate dehydrogenase [Rhodohalobacter halophilus]|uniref:type I glyceraldehyde-3-phosphate dehydrogenase n=1 Tax=Rhodohalobacter halophilus TaxID=1812810 RepID=UPI00083F75FD|nr:type I glyceraldehyde-3-phosphate dehydrogenase [Rhodohalobacter halophilus]
MAKVKVGINGFGRIGRLVMRSILKYQSDDVEVVGINDLTDTKTLAHLFKYDSVHGKFDGDVHADGNNLVINGSKIGVTAERDPANLKWGERGAEVIVESTGIFRDDKGASKHIEAGAKKVIISAPGKGDLQTIVIGVNDNELDKSRTVYSNASCTTNCLAPMVKVLDEAFGVEKGFMTTIHAYTGDQQIVDGPHKDLRRARAAAANIVPTTTGAAAAVGLVLPHLDGKLDGMAVRVPVPDGSLTDFTAVVSKDVTEEQVQEAFKKAAEGELNGVLEFSDEPLVSTDIIGNPHSCIYDSLSTKVDGKLVKIVGWYDNEAGYSARTAELITKIV